MLLIQFYRLLLLNWLHFVAISALLFNLVIQYQPLKIKLKFFMKKKKMYKNKNEVVEIIKYL